MKNTVKILVYALCAALSLAFVSCGQEETEKPSETAAPVNTVSDEQGDVYVDASDKFTDFDRRISFGSDTDVQIKLADGGKTEAGEGVTVSGNVVTIGVGGVYVVSGSLTGGQIVVNVEKTEKVKLVLNGVCIVAPDNGAAIYVKSADKVALTLAEGTENKLSDVSTSQTEGETNACVYSKDDLTINGLGSLEVTASFNNGIYSKNDLKIVSGNVKVKAANNALKGKGSVIINSGEIVVESNDDGIKSDEDTRPEKGFVCIEGGNVSITAADDGINAVTSVTITGGKVNVKAGGKTVKCIGEVNIETGCLVTK